MAVEFSFDHVFTVASPAALVTAYFDPSHLADQDRVAELNERTVVESEDDGAVKRCVWHVRSARSLPFFVRAFVSGGKLAFKETMLWRRADDHVEMSIVPEILGGRVKIAATYGLAQVGPNQVRRRYAGAVTADLALVGGKVERHILGEFEKGMPAMARVTQQWLDAHPA